MISVSRQTSAAMLAGLMAAGLGAEAFAQIQEVIVTTRKREENLQEVPVAVSAFSAEKIQRLGITDLKSLTRQTSGVIFDTGFAPQDTRITIRGLAPVRGRQNVAILQDGIDISSQAIQTNGGGLLINPRLFDLERVEVVKGPQNALYGRTAFNGAINYIMRQPTEDLSIRAYTDVGNNGQAELRGGISGGIVGNTLLGDLSAAVWNHDGFYDNATTGSDLGGQNGTAYAGSLVWNATEKLSFRLRAEVLDDEFDPFPYRQLPGNTLLPVPLAARTPLGGGVTSVVSPAVTQVNAWVGTLPDGASLTPGISPNPRGGDYPGTERDINRFTLTGKYDFDAVSLTYLGHVANAETEQFYDSVAIGNSAVEFVGGEIIFDDETDLQSHELRLTSNGDNTVDWVVGGLYWKEEVDFNDGGFNCINNRNQSTNPADLPYPPCASRIASVSVRGSPGSPLNADFWGRDTEHYSAYGLVDWEFRESFNLILEGRYTWEDLDVVGPNRPGQGDSRIIGDLFLVAVPFPPFQVPLYPQVIPANSGLIPASKDDDFFSPKATLQWRPTDASMVYFSWAQAAKPAGIALLTGGAAGFNPKEQSFEREEMQVWELGAKSAWLDQRLTLNGAVFFQDYSDKQVSVQAIDEVTGLVVPRTTNAASAEVWGLEFDTQWAATDNLSLYASYTFLDTEYADFTEVTTGVGNIAQASVRRPDNCTAAIPPGAGPLVVRPSCFMDLSGNELEYAPRHALVVGFTLEAPLSGDLTGFFEGNGLYQDERFLDRFNVAKLDSYTVFDFRLGIRTDRWDVLAYMDNAFNDETIKTGTSAVLTRDARSVGFPGPFTFVIPPSVLTVLPDQRQFGIRANFRFGG